MRFDGEYIKFESTGKRGYCFSQIVGIRKDEDGNFFVSYGADGSIDHPWDGEHHLSKAEKKELADYMIALWAEYGAINE